MRRVLHVLALCSLSVTAAAEEQLAVRAVRATTIDLRPAIRVLTAESLPRAAVAREGEFVTLRFAGAAGAGLALPPLEPPLETIAVERQEASTVLRVKVAPDVPFEVAHEPGMLTVVFGQPPSPELRGPVTPELYQRLFPTAVADTPAPAETEGPAAGAPEGLTIGRLTLRPYVSAAWIDADVLAFDSPVPVRDQYLQLAPGVTASFPVSHGLLQADYEARLRYFSDIPEVGDTSHLAGARLDLPLGSRAQLRVGHRYTRATLETTVVDPGREYYFDLARYTFNESQGFLRLDLGSRFWAEGEARFSWNRFDETGEGGFFDYDNRALRAGLGYDIGRDLRATVSYGFERMPPSPDRAIVETTAHQLLATLTGEIGTFTSGNLTFGLRSQEHPLASGASASWQGLTLTASLRRELGPSTSVELTGVRSSDPSSFDTNAFYLNNSLSFSLTTAGPFELWLRGGAGFLRNDYPNDAPELGVPRRDEVWAWSVGVGRNLGWRAWVRADYRWEDRNSNVPGFDVSTDGFIVQLGLGLFGPGPGAQ